MNSAVSLGSSPRRREPIPRALTNTEYGSPPSRGRRRPRADHPETVSVRLGAGKLDHLGPLLGFLGDEPAEVGGRAGKHDAARVGETRLHLGIGKGRVVLLVERLDDFP